MLDDRSYFHYMATGITPAMTEPPVGSGSVYCMTARDMHRPVSRRRQDLQGRAAGADPGQELLVVHVPTAGRHRSILETDQKAGGLDSKSPDRRREFEDGSVTVWLGPEAPEGKRGKLDPDHAWKELQHDVPALWPPAALVRQDLAARRF